MTGRPVESLPKFLASMSDWVRTSGSWEMLMSATVGDCRQSIAIAWREERRENRVFAEGNGYSQETNLVEVTLDSADADNVQRRLAILENYVVGMAATLGSEDDVVRSRHAAHPANGLHSPRGKGLIRD